MGVGSQQNEKESDQSKLAPAMFKDTVVHVSSQPDDVQPGSPEYRVWEYLLHEHGVNLRQYELDLLMDIATSG